MPSTASLDRQFSGGSELGGRCPDDAVQSFSIKQRDNSLLVAVEDGSIFAVGSVTDAGKITLNYVSPDVRFLGVSRALLGALEGGPQSEATYDARSPAPRRPAASITQRLC